MALFNLHVTIYRGEKLVYPRGMTVDDVESKEM